MGGCGSSKSGAGPQSPEDCVAAAFHDKGIYLFNAAGGYSKVNDETWMRVQGVLPIAADKVIAIHPQGVYKMTVFPSYKCEKLEKGESWHMGGPMIRSPDAPDQVYVLHDLGVFLLDSNTGASTKVNSECWKGVTGVCWVPDDGMEGPGFAVVFHHMGVYRVDPKKIGDPCVKLSGESWMCHKGAAWNPEKRKIVVFHDWGTYHVDPTTGVSEKFSGDHWMGNKGTFSAGDGHCLCLHDHGTYKVNMSEYKCDKLDESGWMRMKAVTETSPGACASMHHMDNDNH